MKEITKFSFRSLDTQAGGIPDGLTLASKKRAYTDAQIEEIRDGAMADGMLAGEQAALQRIERRVEENLQIILANLSELHSEIEEKLRVLRAEAAELSLLVAKKLAASLIARQPLAEIEELFSACASSLNAEPRIVIRADESQAGILQEKIETLSRKAGYPGKIVIIGEPDMRDAQCQIEWSDGGVTYRSPDQLEYIDRLIREYAALADVPHFAESSLPFVSTALADDVNQPVMDNVQ